MLLSSLIVSSDDVRFAGSDPDISGLTEDSRKVQPGYLFIATPGTKQDGRDFIDDAIKRGAVAVLVPEDNSESGAHAPLRPSSGGEGLSPHFKSHNQMFGVRWAMALQKLGAALSHLTPPSFGKAEISLSPLSPRRRAERGTTAAPAQTIAKDIAILKTPDIRKATAQLAAAFYPRQPETVAAVTGTSGKTSVAQFTREIWQALGHKSASIGTLGLVTAKGSAYGSLTTPDAITLHHLLDECAHNGVTHAVMEASSHGIELNRLDCVHLEAGGFTNLSRDHLDYHQTMEAYFAAKLRLFSELLPMRAAAVLNADIPEYAALADAAKKRSLQIIAYGKNGMDMRLLETRPDPRGQVLQLEIFGKKHEALLPVIGDFQIANALCAAGLVIGSGGDADAVIQVLAKVTGVPGRLQLVGATKSGGMVFVDYAHKPDALENVLRTMRSHASAHNGKLGVVFGCGGNRDKGKRPIMGEIAQKQADWVIVTDDNPRHEESASIRAEILAGCKDRKNVSEIGDRATAIAEGIGRLQAGDVLIIAGKGHEPGQIVGDKVLPFDDAEEARKVLGL